MFKLDLEKAEEPEVKLLTSIGGGLVPKSCPTLCEPMDYSLPGSSFHWILWARILEQVAISFFRGSY